jgi:NADPH:quinone reductase-like Zn-dependent oxidoreductase
MTHPTRQTVRVYQYGGLDQLKRETIPCPQPQTGEVLIRIHATGVLPADWKMRQGYFHSYNPQTFPYIPGW